MVVLEKEKEKEKVWGVLCVHCFYQYFIIACLWLDHPYVCTVRVFSIERCIVSLELDRADFAHNSPR